LEKVLSKFLRPMGAGFFRANALKTLFQSEALQLFALVRAGRQGFIETLVNPQKTLKSFTKLAAHTRFRAIVNAPLK